MSEYMTYSNSERKLWKEGNLVYKVDPNRLGDAWQEQMKHILTIYRPPVFVDFIPYGYVTRYIEGVDLHGNSPFSYAASPYQTNLAPCQRMDVLDIFSECINVGKNLGFTFGDISCSNMMTAGPSVYLIDYEVITSFPLTEDYQAVWNNTLKLIFQT